MTIHKCCHIMIELRENSMVSGGQAGPRISGKSRGVRLKGERLWTSISTIR
jgi:hypothetical protein